MQGPALVRLAFAVAGFACFVACGTDGPSGPGRTRPTAEPPSPTPTSTPYVRLTPLPECGNLPVLLSGDPNQLTGLVGIECLFPPEYCEKTYSMQFFYQPMQPLGPIGDPTLAVILGIDEAPPWTSEWDTRRVANGRYYVGCCTWTVYRHNCNVKMVTVAN